MTKDLLIISYKAQVAYMASKFHDKEEAYYFKTVCAFIVDRMRDDEWGFKTTEEWLKMRGRYPNKVVDIALDIYHATTEMLNNRFVNGRCTFYAVERL